MPVERPLMVPDLELAPRRGWLRVLSDSLLALSVLSLALYLLRDAVRPRPVGAPAARAGERIARSELRTLEGESHAV